MTDPTTDFATQPPTSPPEPVRFVERVRAKRRERRRDWHAEHERRQDTTREQRTEEA